MAMLKAYPNGATMGRGNPNPVGGRRTEVVGWSPSSVRRHKRWLYSVEADNLTGRGAAVTLSVRDIPESNVEWTGMLQRLFKRLRHAGFVRWHWVVEWQRRGAPHVHLAVYDLEADPAVTGAAVRSAWLDVAREYRPLQRGQYVTPIRDAAGWLQYLSKHASRGVAHYQRQGMPPGWTKTGRLWGYGGSWPIGEPIEIDLSQAQEWRVRRMIRRRAIAVARREALAHEARGEMDRARVKWGQVVYCRGMLKCSDRSLSTVRGFSSWVPQEVMLGLAGCAGWDGTLSEVNATV